MTLISRYFVAAIVQCCVIKVLSESTTQRCECVYCQAGQKPRSGDCTDVNIEQEDCSGNTSCCDWSHCACYSNWVAWGCHPKDSSEDEIIKVVAGVALVVTVFGFLLGLFIFIRCSRPGGKCYRDNSNDDGTQPGNTDTAISNETFPRIFDNRTEPQNTDTAISNDTFTNMPDDGL